MADSSRHALYIIPEATYGTTPATPAFLRVRITGTTLGLSKDSLISEELRSDRQIVDHQFGVKQIGGDISMELTADQQLRTLMEAALMDTWETNILKAGTIRRAFSILRHFEDVPALDKKYLLYRGCEVNTMSLTNSANDRLGLTFGFVGQSQAVSSVSQPAGSTLGVAGTDSMMTGLLGAVNEGGSPISIVTEANFTLENGLEIRPVIGSDTTLFPSVGRSNVSGQVTAYFENAALLDKFIAGGTSSLSFVCNDVADKAFTFLFPKIKYTGGQPDVSGQGSVTIALPFQALYDTVTATNLRVTYTP